MSTGWCRDPEPFVFDDGSWLGEIQPDGHRSFWECARCHRLNAFGRARCRCGQPTPLTRGAGGCVDADAGPLCEQDFQLFWANVALAGYLAVLPPWVLAEYERQGMVGR